MGIACASDNITSDDLAINDESPIEINDGDESSISISDDEVISAPEGSFSDIQTMIDYADDGDTIVLSGTYLGSGTQISITKPVNIDGNNSILDAKNLSRIFYISADNVTLKNIIFTNGKAPSSGSGGAVQWRADDGTIENCQFNNNNANDGGALYYKGSNGVIKDSSFENNSAFYNGAVYMNSLNGKILNCNFTNNYASNSSGALGWVKKSNGLIYNSRFTDNTALFGGAIYINNATNLRIEKSVFENNFAFRNGGAIYWDSGNECVLADSTFKNNGAHDFGGAIYYDEDNNIDVSNCDFIDCYAEYGGGGAIYCYNVECSNVMVTGCSFVNCRAATSAGAIRLYSNNGNITSCDFVNCSSKEFGGAIYLSGNDTSVSSSNFINCSSNDGGAIYWEGNNGYVFGCSFVNCSCENDGGAINWYWESKNGRIFGSSFVNCTSVNSGGAVYWGDSGGKIENSSFINNDADFGWAIYSDDGFKIVNCKFIGKDISSIDDAVSGGTIQNCDINVKLDTRTTVTTDTDAVHLGEKITIIADVLDPYSRVSGVAKIFIDDNPIGTADIGKEFYYTPTDSGTHNVVAKFEGSEDYTASQSESLEFTVAVAKTTPTMTISPEDIVYGQKETVTVTLPSDATNTVTFALFKGDESILNLTSSVTDGSASCEFADLVAGQYNVKIEYSGDDNYNGASNNTVFVVRPIVEIAQNVTVGDDVRVFMDFGYNVTGSIIVRVNNKGVGFLDIEEGVLNDTFPTAKLTAGNHTVTFQDEGDLFDINILNYWDVKSNKYLPVKYEMQLKPIDVSIPEVVESNDDGIIVLVFPENATGTIEVYVDGVKAFVVQIINDMARIDLSKYKNGNHKITFVYSGDDVYAAFNKTVQVKVIKIVANDLKVVYTENAKYSVTVYADDKPESGVEVTFLLNDKAYKTATTNSNGVASIDLSQTPGTYKITTVVSNISVTKTLTVTHLLSLKTVKVKKSAKKLVLTATLKKVNGKYLKKKTVTFKFNGKKYKAKTNKKGVAKVTIKSKVLKKLKVGKKVKYQAKYKETVTKKVKVKK
ncbi:Ig-like domain repeat protein [Methanobrevibacter sp.]|uniref:Ig-like domain repeat protein n=1 Tax=Methanobrevibacter sp. TaxID=66852 RepID=UPI003890B27D